MIAKAISMGTLMAFALLGWAGHAECASTDTGTLQVEIVDGSTGQVVPAMVCITQQKFNGNGRVQLRFFPSSDGHDSMRIARP